MAQTPTSRPQMDSHRSTWQPCGEEQSAWSYWSTEEATLMKKTMMALTHWTWHAHLRQIQVQTHLFSWASLTATMQRLWSQHRSVPSPWVRILPRSSFLITQDRTGKIAEWTATSHFLCQVALQAMAAALGHVISGGECLETWGGHRAGSWMDWGVFEALLAVEAAKIELWNNMILQLDGLHC